MKLRRPVITEFFFLSINNNVTLTFNVLNYCKLELCKNFYFFIDCEEKLTTFRRLMLNNNEN